MVATFERQIIDSPIFDENTRIPRELNAQSRVFELKTVRDARMALARLRELRRDFDIGTKDNRSETNREFSHFSSVGSPAKGEEMLAGLSNIQRMRTIRSEIAYLEDLMVRIAAREFELEEKLHRSYLSGIGQWSEREWSQHLMS